MIVWIVLNVAAVRLRWDPYPFILLNLAFSTQAAYAAPLILLAQNRQADRDRVQAEEDRARAASVRADTEYLARELASLRVAVGELATRDFIRSELRPSGPRYTTLHELVAETAKALGRPAPRGHVPLFPVKVAARLCELLCKPFGICGRY